MKITIVRGQEEWEGLYIDGELQQERSSLELMDVLHLLAQKREQIDELDWFTLNDEADEKLMSRGCLPDSLDEVRRWERE